MDFPISTQMSNSPALVCLTEAYCPFCFLGCQDREGETLGADTVPPRLAPDQRRALENVAPPVQASVSSW